MSDLVNSLTEVIDNQGVDQDTLRSLAGLLVMPEGVQNLGARYSREL